MAVAPVAVLQVVQAGLETTIGIAVPATRVVDFDPGKAVMRRTSDTIIVPQAGSRSGGSSAWAGAEDVELEIPFYVSADDWPWWGNLFVQPLTTGTGAGANKTYAQTPPDTSVAFNAGGALGSATFEVAGKDTWPSSGGGFQIAGCIGKTLDLSIAPNTVWQAKAVLMGMKTVQQALTGALSARTFAARPTGPTTKVYLDTTSAFGTTQLVGRSVRADIKLDLKPQSRHTIDGQTTPYRLAIPEPYAITVKLIAEFSSIAEYNNWINKTTQRVRVAYVGPTLGSGTYQINWDITGVWATSAPIADDKGVYTIELDLDQLFDSTLNAAHAWTTVQSVTPLP